MYVAISCFKIQRGGVTRLFPIAPGLFDWSVTSRDPAKGWQRMIERIKKEAPKLPFARFGRLVVPPGRLLERLHLELKVSGDGEKKHVAGIFPLIVEPRPAGDERVLRIGYHPLRPNEWFELDPERALADQAKSAYSKIFDPDDDFDELKLDRGDKLTSARIAIEPPSLLDTLKPKDAEKAAGFGRSGELSALLRIAVNQTARAAERRLSPGMPREPLRSRLQQLLCGPVKKPVLVVGPPGSGKSTLIARAVHDLLEADGYSVHDNLDRVHNVLALRGRHIIAGMSYVGQWEARAVELLERARKKKLVLWVDDLHAWGSLGRTVASERNLADFFRGPIARRELIVIGECTPEALSLLEHEAPALANAFTRVHVEPASERQTLEMLLHESRRLESELPVAFEPECFRAIVDYAGSLFRGTSFPGKALGPLGALSKLGDGSKADAEHPHAVGFDDVRKLFCQRTGLPEILLTSEPPLERARLERELGQQILGQGTALETAADLVLSIRARACAPGRPYGVFLFTGPTGTGKTELAKCIAEYLYGDGRRLVRFDMGEFNTADAPGRLIGDRSEPQGLLTSAVRAQPFSLLLLDEIEKAHPLVLNLMLQVFDDGRLADARGAVADFTHAVIVMTSNLGSEQRSVRGFVADPSAVTLDVARAVSDFFPAELFNRIDRVVSFAPLDRKAAQSIARKELAALAARPGLSHRSIFLRITESSIAEVVDAGYDAAYGARALKRYIDREVGDRLSRAIASERATEMRLLWLYRGSSGLGVHAESLREAEPLSASSPLEELLSEPEKTLRRRVPEALELMRRMEREGQLERIEAELSRELEAFRRGEERRADPIHHLDAFRAHVAGLKRRFESLVATDSELQALERHRKRDAGDELSAEDYSTLGDTPFYERHGHGHRRPPKRTFTFPRLGRKLLADLAEVSLLEQLFGSARSSGEHGVLLDLVRLAAHHERRRFSSGSPGLLEWLALAYAKARGRFEDGAVTLLDGRMLVARSFDELVTLLEHRPRQAALRISGTGVRRFFAGENGCHVRRSVGLGPEIVRVLVGSAEVPPLEHLQKHAERRAAFEAYLEDTGAEREAELFDNPEALLPVVRGIHFDPDPWRPTPASIEDYRLSYIASRRVQALDDLLSELWLLSAALSEAPEDSS